MLEARMIPGDTQAGISVSGEGRATGKPDLAIVILGVWSEEKTVGSARTKAAQAMSAIQESMKRNGVAAADMQTTQFRVEPQFDYTKQRQVLRGFRVTHDLTAKVRDIDRTDKVVDDAIVAGGDSTRVQELRFSIENPEALRTEARKKAVADAKAKAQTLAAAAETTLGRPIAISESGGVVRPLYKSMRTMAVAEEAAPPSPIATGDLDIVITVQVTYAVN